MLKPLVRSLAFLSNWTAWVVRQPSMLLTMILGPFLILGLFALSNAAQGMRSDVIVVRPTPTPGSVLVPTDVLNRYFNVVAETEDRAWARDQLAKRQVDAVLVLPADPRDQLARGEQAQIRVETNEIDPISLAFLRADLRGQVADLNQAVQAQGVEQTKARAAATSQRLDASLARLDQIDRNADNPEAARRDVQELDRELSPALDTVPTVTAAARASTLLLTPEQASPILTQADAADRTAVEARATLLALRVETESPIPNPARIRELSLQLRGQISSLREQMGAVQRVPTSALVAPFEGTVEQTVPYRPTLITFYAPAALALLLQHFAVTLAALSMVRARLLGMVEFWRLAPVRPGEIMAGNYLSYGLLAFVAWVVLTAAVVYFLNLPVLGSPSYLVGAAALLILASLGIGFVISLVAGNEQQAAQLAMLVLLGSVFLSGFVRPLEAIDMPVRLISYLLPASFGIQLFQDVMLRGVIGEMWFYYALGVLSVLGMVLSLALFRRELRPI